MADRPFIDFAWLKRQAGFAAVLDAYGLRPKGARALARGTKIRCPFHDDHEPSLGIDPARKIFHCFGCGAKGNILDFVARMEGLDPKAGLRDAAVRLAAICGLPLAPEEEAETGSRSRPRRAAAPARTPTPPEPAPEPRLERNPGCFALKFVEHAHPYLEARGLDPDAAAAFGIGFYAGKGSMRGRVVIPILDWWPDDPEPSRLVAYIGRWPGDDVPKGEPRYKLPAEFRKNQVVYNLHRIVGARHVHLVEGCFDAVHLHRLGFPAVALMGRALAPEQLLLLARAGVRHVTVLLDGDPQGREAARAVHAALGTHGLFSRIVDLPDGSDPATLDRDAFMALHRSER